MGGFGYPYEKQEKGAVIVISIIFLVTVVVAFSVGIAVGFKSKSIAEKEKETENIKKAIAAVCEPTEYREKCIQRLEFHAGNISDPEELIRVVFKLAMKHFRKAGNVIVTLKEIEKDPRTNNTLQGCKELMHKSIRELKRSYKLLGESHIKDQKNLLEDLMTWLSATITYQETCLEGFDEKTTNSVAKKMRETLNNSMELTRDAIAMVSIVNQVIDFLKSKGNVLLFGHGSRRLLEVEEKPNNYWLGHTGNRSTHLEALDVDKFKPNFVVAKDGSGRFTTINHALIHVPREQDKPTVIYIKEGIYNEIVHIPPDMTHLVLIGDGANKTRITGSLNYVDGTPTWKTATFAVSAAFFTAKNIGFENSAGPTRHQAVALRVDADKSIFYNCTMDGYQVTLYVHTKRQFYWDCTISGTIDFVFGDGSAVFYNCNFIIRKPLEKQNCIVTAQGRNYTYQPTAIVIQNSTITADPGFLSVNGQHKAYLGRPWREYSRVIIMESFIDRVIDPSGWLPWDGEKGINTCFYAEFDNTGPGANKTQRVNWKGLKNISREEAQQFTAGRIIEGDEWIATVTMPYNSGLFTNQTDDHNNLG
ncbi:hypothetical protein LWI28_016043 [Acer negundo]|uniref:Pectinesterase n=1 Tax=Acer negundo TaxID=4023 RepID=A0AAD5NXH3_ACENE|nr:hypothetical protein LWI28_016043 [Acer negundo]KAK4852029.1 hypothetical protein QYF36_020503 [Acer negundo]